jgi:hypothetical protein
MSSQSKIAAALGVARKTRVLKADGGNFSNSQRLAEPPVLDQLPSIPTVPVAPSKKTVHHLHTGPVRSGVAGRTDHLPVNVPSQSYVLPAHHVSALGESNTEAGFKVIRRIFGGVPYSGAGMPYGQNSGPYGSQLPGKSEGGSAGNVGSPVPVVIAGGEFVLNPAEVAFAGDGDMQAGHAALDDWVKRQQAMTAKTIKNLPAPRRD